MWRLVGKLIGKAVEKARGIDASDVMTQSTGSDVLDLIRDLLW